MKRATNYLRGVCVVLSMFFISCESEGLYVKEKVGKKSNVTVRHLKNNEAKKAVGLLKRIPNLSYGGNTMKANEPLTVDYNDILEVIDSLGRTNYSYKVINHPDDNFKTFHNLVLTEIENQIKVSIMKYEMTDLFAQEYYSKVKSFTQFEGNVSTAELAPFISPCEEIGIHYPSEGGSGGNGSGDGDGSGDGPGSIGGPGGGGYAGCLALTFICSCGRTYDSWTSYHNSICGDGSNPGYDLTIVVTTSPFCRTASNPCGPKGSIGVVPPVDDCNSFSKRVKEVLDTEGGFVYDPADPGGATNRGISWPVWVENANNLFGIQPTLENLQAITVEQAETIYKTNYWDKVRCDEISDGDLRYLLFDFNVNSGKNAVRVLKETLNSLGFNLTVNGTMDDLTIEVINGFGDIKALYNLFKQRRQDYYNEITQKSIEKYLQRKPNATAQQVNTKTFKRFIDGWTNRVNKFLNKTDQRLIDVNC